MKKGKKIFFVILGTLLGIVLLLVGVVSVVAKKNVKVMNHCIESIMEELLWNNIFGNYGLCILDAGPFTCSIESSMNFLIEQNTPWDAQRHGRRSFCYANVPHASVRSRLFYC